MQRGHCMSAVCTYSRLLCMAPQFHHLVPSPLCISCCVTRLCRWHTMQVALQQLRQAAAGCSGQLKDVDRGALAKNLATAAKGPNTKTALLLCSLYLERGNAANAVVMDVVAAKASASGHDPDLLRCLADCLTRLARDPVCMVRPAGRGYTVEASMQPASFAEGFSPCCLQGEVDSSLVATLTASQCMHGHDADVQLSVCSCLVRGQSPRAKAHGSVCPNMLVRKSPRFHACASAAPSRRRLRSSHPRCRGLPPARPRCNSQFSSTSTRTHSSPTPRTPPSPRCAPDLSRHSPCPCICFPWPAPLLPAPQIARYFTFYLPRQLSRAAAAHSP